MTIWRGIRACLAALIAAAFLLPPMAASAADGSGPVPDRDPAWFESFEEIGRDEAYGLADGGGIAFAGQAGPDIYIEASDGGRYWYEDGSGELAMYLRFKGTPAEELWPVRIDPSHSDGADEPERASLLGTLPWMVLIAGIGACFAVACGKARMRRMRAAEPSPASEPRIEPAKPRARADDVPPVRFSDVEGVDGLKRDIMRLVDCLKRPERYRAMGARPCRGVILYGPPGTGKTLLAKAIAGEAGVPFFPAIGSDFVEKYVGVGAKRVRELYAKARKAAPCIVFIDEIDAVASKRGSDENSERDGTVNALLAELDGFGASSGVVTVCATNRLEMLDDAFKRAGRFDLKLAVGLPDLGARKRILEIHAKGKRLSEGVSLDALARRCYGFSGADLEALLNEAALEAVGRDHDSIMPDDVDDAFFKIVMQGNKKPREADREAEARLVAWHEAGHALAAKLLTGDSVPSVTIVGSSSGAGGVTFRVPEREGLQSRKYIRAQISIMYAGRAAEELFLGDADEATTGASQDIRQATVLIRDYIGSYGMGRAGMLDMSAFGKEASVLEEASAMAKAVYADTAELLRGNRDRLERLASALYEKETLDEAEIDALIA